MAHPSAIKDRGLEDDVVAAFHGLDRLRRARLIGGPITFADVEAGDRPTLAAQLRYVPLLVLATAALKELDLWIVASVGLPDQAGHCRPIKLRQMAACQEPNQVRGRDDQLAIAPMHRPTLPAPVSAPAVPQSTSITRSA